MTAGDLGGAGAAPLAATATVAFLVLVLAAAYFVPAAPLADDLLRAASVRAPGSAGVVSLTAQGYATWSGRWAAIGSSYLFARIFDPLKFYWVGLAAVGIVNLLAFWCLASAVLARPPFSSQALAAGLFLAAWHWLSLPFPQESCYWLSGGLDNAMGIALGVLALSLAASLPLGRTDFREWGRTAALSLILFVATAYHELFGGVLVVATLSGYLVTRRRLPHLERRFLALIVASGISFLVVVLAPGNYARGVMSAGGHQFHQFFTQQSYPTLSRMVLVPTLSATHLLAVDLFRWLVSVTFVFGSLVIWLLGQAAADKRPIARFPWRGVAVGVPLTLSLVWVCYLVPGLLLNFVPERTANGAMTVAFVAWSGSMLFLARMTGQRVYRAQLTPTVAGVALVLASGLAALASPNARAGLRDLPLLGSVRRAHEARFEWLRSARPQGKVAVVVPDNVPSCTLLPLAKLDIQPEVSAWQNAGWSKYFLLPRVVREDRHPIWQIEELTAAPTLGPWQGEQVRTTLLAHFKPWSLQLESSTSLLRLRGRAHQSWLRSWSALDDVGEIELELRPVAGASLRMGARFEGMSGFAPYHLYGAPGVLAGGTWYRARLSLDSVRRRSFRSLDAIRLDVITKEPEAVVDIASLAVRHHD